MQTFTAPISTSYRIQCWGASGGNSYYGMSGVGPTGHTNTVYGGKGGYCSGKIIFPYNQSVFVYVGQSGEEIREQTFNGGGTAGINCNAFSGGGATDIRLIDGDWNDFKSLKSRIIVAAGGGGAQHYHTGSNGGYAGGLIGQNGFYSSNPDNSHDPYTVSIGATQTSGGKGGIGENSSPDGTFGIGGNGNVSFSGESSWGSGGGSGYYGGGGGGVNHWIVGSGSGGSSFISGYSGCDAIAESSTEGDIIHTNQPNHYSGKVFINPVMIDGGSVMPKPRGGTETGHSGNGYCIISWISPTL